VAEFTRDDVHALAGAKSFERGIGYVDAVRGMDSGGDAIHATVQGTLPYQVRLYRSGDVLDGDCDCPHGQEGNFCKHCVAVALAYLDSRVRGALRTRGTMRAAAEAGTGPDLQDRRRHVAEMLYADDCAGGDDAWDYAHRISDVCDELARLHEGGQSTAAMTLAGCALEEVGLAFDRIDDSWGYIRDAAYGLTELHAKVCRAARPDPPVLASWLLQFQTAGYYCPELSIGHYAETLGEPGRAAYGDQLTELWEKRNPGEEGRTSSLMEQWAQACGDVDLLVTVLSAERPRGIDYLRIAEVLTEAERAAEALDWAERGLRDGPAHRDRRLADFVARVYSAAGRPADVLALRRTEFERHRALDVYQALRGAAMAVDEWAAVRDWALGLLRSDSNGVARSGYAAGEASQVLIEVLLWEGATEEAWAVAAAAGARRDQWLRLAESRSATHPGDAIPVYERLIEEKVAVRKNHAYAEAADLAVRVRELYRRLGSTEDAARFLWRLRAAHKPKRNFMAELKRRGL
jgi:hypothetical protein